MEVFKLSIDGSYRFTFRKSLKQEVKNELCEKLITALEEMPIRCTKKIIKGVLVCYITPTPQNQKVLTEFLMDMKNDLFMWGNF